MVNVIFFTSLYRVFAKAISFEKFVNFDVLVQFNEVAVFTKFYDATDQRIFRVIEFFFESYFSCYNFDNSFFFFSVDLVDSLFLCAVNFHCIPVFNNINQSFSPLTKVNRKVNCFLGTSKRLLSLWGSAKRLLDLYRKSYGAQFLNASRAISILL